MDNSIVGRTMKKDDDEAREIVVDVQVEEGEIMFTSPSDKDLYLVVDEKQLKELLKE